MTLTDPSSHSNFQVITTTHIHWVGKIDFDKHLITGHATYDLKSLADFVEEVVFDTKTLVIERVEGNDGKVNLQFVLQPVKVEAFGQALRVKLAKPLNMDETTQVTIHYTTSPSASALQWLSPAQTAGGKHPFLFTQCQCIHARSMLPVQDTPAAKITYTATITSPDPTVTLMSAESTGSEKAFEDGWTTYHFRQKIPIPSYLIALAAGHLVSKEIGPRTLVWAEPETLEAAAWEFEETEEYISIAEQVCGPYVWGRYDLIVLPPSFPYGGMENPMLTFVTPTLLSGDRSQTCLVAHEIAHSWTGNLVTNATWEHFWLNEGFTKYTERLILRRKFGEGFRHMHAMAGWEELKLAIEYYGKDHEFTKLVPKLDGVDPDDSFSRVPYEKGCNFLFFLEGLIGGVEEMEKYLKAHCEKFGYKTATTAEWREFFTEYLKNNGKESVIPKIDFDTWLHGTGMPPFDPIFDKTLTKACEDLAQRWADAASGTENAKRDFSERDLTDFLPQQVSALMSEINNRTSQSGRPFPHELLSHLDSTYHVSDIRNPEVKLQWYLLCLRAGYDPVFGDVVKFITSQGRMKYVRQLYRALFKASPAGKELALTTFKEHRGMYHSIAQTMLARDLGLA